MQKTYTDENYRQRRNEGQLDRYLDEENHEALVSREEFAAVQELIKRRAVNPKGHTAATRHNPLICIKCGKPLNREGSGEKVFYRCKSDEHCRIRVYEDDLKAMFVTMLNKLRFSQGLDPRRRLLNIYEEVMRNEGETDFRDLHRLRDAIEGREISEQYGEVEKKIMEEYVGYIVVEKKKLVFHFKCGLWLDEHF